MEKQEQKLLCVMCGRKATHKGKPTNEDLCLRCYKINEEILKHKKDVIITD